MKTIGTITLKKAYTFTQYSECAAWTDYVKCEPQTVELRTDGYWVCAKFNGILETSTFPNGSRNVGQPAQACIQTQKHGGIGGWMDSEFYKVEIIDPSLAIRAIGQYPDGCGSKTGQPILALLEA